MRRSAQQGRRTELATGPDRDRFIDLGYDVLMFDLRGSGLSMGSNQTLAHKGPRDLLGAYDHML